MRKGQKHMSMDQMRGRCNPVPPAGMRPDRETDYGIPVPDDQSIMEQLEFRHFQQHGEEESK